MLVVGLVMNQVNDQTDIEFQLITGQRVNLNLPQTVLQLMVTLLNKLQDNAAWGLTQDDTTALPLAATPPRMH